MPRKVLITSDGSGSGRYIAKAFLKQDDQVFVCDIHKSALHNFQKDFPKLHIYHCDLSQIEAISSMFDVAMHYLNRTAHLIFRNF